VDKAQTRAGESSREYGAEVGASHATIFRGTDRRRLDQSAFSPRLGAVRSLIRALHQWTPRNDFPPGSQRRL